MSTAVRQVPDRSPRPLTNRLAPLAAWRILLAAFIGAAMLVPGSSARAQDDLSWSRSYINPFPDGEQYNMYVLGDALASGLAGGLSRSLEASLSIKITADTNAASGLARPDRFDWSRHIANLIKSNDIHIAVIMVGINDQVSMRTAGGMLRFGTPEWLQAYAWRVEAIVKQLTEAKVAVYWVGLPVVADPDQAAAIETINQIIRERTYLGGVKYIETWNSFIDQFGNYSAFGPDVTGVTKRLRDGNGVGFTADGYAKLANYVETVIKRDLAAARRERSIPLDGDETQQQLLARGLDDARAINPGALQPPTPNLDDGGLATDDDSPASLTEQPRPPAAYQSPSRGYSYSDYAPTGELLAADIGDGLTALATISPADALSLQSARQQAPLSQRLYYRVLIQGDKLNARKGRVDDYAWPGG
jgi:hypothetical protein